MSENWERFDPQSRHWRVIDGGARPKPAPSLGAAVRADRRRRIDWWCRFVARVMIGAILFVVATEISGSNWMVVGNALGLWSLAAYGYGQPKP